MNDLHYGLWPEDLAPTPQNLPEAQARYTAFVLDRIPTGVRSVLDVGCGAGNTAAALLERGYTVDCLSPNPHLNGIVRERLGERVGVFDTRFQDYATEARYDLILFSESLLFIHPLPQALAQAAALLTPGGHVLISDMFRTTTIHDPGPIGGGHYLATFEAGLGASTLEVVEDHDITAQVAPSFDVLDRAYQAMRPGYDLVLTQLAAKHPFWFRLMRWFFRKTLERYEAKHFSGERNAANFQRYKRYRVLLLQAPPPP